MGLSTTEKGRQFEVEVEEWLRRNGYRDTERNVKVRVSEDVKPYECDVHGHSYSAIWIKLRRLGIGWFVLVWIYLLLDAGGLRTATERAITTFELSASDASLLLIGVIGFVLGMVGKKRTGHHAWVECKNLKGKVSRDHVMKLAHAIELLEAYKSADWSPRYAMIFSATDFERDALHFARQHSIRCFRRTESGFKELI